MKILLSNDDGYQAPGIVALYEAIKDLGDVEVVAPEHNNSAKSNALTLHSPLYVHLAGNGFRYVNGTPADCVHVALTGLLGYRPDLVVSGINNGANMGDDTIYSGTVGAAMEGYLFGVPAIAFSQTQKGWAHIDAAARKARELVRQMLSGAAAAPHPWLLNVNIPNLPFEELKPFKVCRLGRRHAAEKVISQTSPRGEVMYWIGGAGPAKDDAEGTDFHATAQGHVSVTPLKVDLTDHEQLDHWARAASLSAAAEARDGCMSRRPGFPVRLDLPAAGRTVPASTTPVVARAGIGGGIGLDSQAVRARMVERLAAQGIADARVLAAMRAVERHRFVDSALVNQAYEDTSLPIGLGQTISKPSVVARMIELLLAAKVDAAGRLGRVLEVGTGCGYQAAVLARVATEVYSIERLRGLHDKARANLRSLRLPNVHLLLGDGMAGYAKGAPYAGIIAAAGGQDVPDAWMDQLAVGARIVAPRLMADGQQALVVIEKTPREMKQTVLETVRFVPLKSGIA